MHGYLGHEGLPPGELLGIARAEVRSYGGEVLADRVVTVAPGDDDQFRVELASGNALVARRVIAATGLVDELPDIAGLAEHWGRDVIHCPFCDGFEVRDQRIVQVVTHPLGLHQAGLFRQLTARLVVVLHAGVDAGSAEVVALRDAGVEITDVPVRRVVADNGRIAGVELDDGHRLDAETVVVGPRFRVRAEPFTALGLVPTAHPSGFGDHLETDAMGATTVPGVYAAGNVTDPSQQVLHAAANGSRVGAMVAVDLAQRDVAIAARISGNETDWDRRYRRGPVFSRNPNPTLVAETVALAPGRALDVGAGEGADAIWLARNGWTVTANDIAQRALDRIQADASPEHLPIDFLRGDANSVDLFEPEAFDLVTAHYASIPRTPDNRAIRNVLGAVKDGGTLLVVAHDPRPLRDPASAGIAFDPDAFIRIEDYRAVLAATPGWHIEVDELRPRPVHPEQVAHHANDVVLRARRRVDLDQPPAHAFDKTYWDAHWERADDVDGGDVSAANPYLERELAGLEPGVALDAGCGGGAEAIWLAERGSQVVAADIAVAALARAARRADHHGVERERLRWVEADLGTWEPGTRFDLVMTHYAHPAVPQLDFYERIARWVASRGTLLVVGHRHADDHGAETPAEASVTAAAVAEILDPADWDVVTVDEPTRTVVKKGRSIELRDVVVRATRRH